jgi:hypothetical protein
MYVEERIYTLHPGTAPEYLTLNMIVHMWGYDSLDQREKCRAAMSADPDWQEYLKKIRPLMKRQESRIMKCAPFFAERLKKMLAAAG